MCIHVYLYVYIYIYNLHTYIYIYIYIYLLLYVCLYIYIYISYTQFAALPVQGWHALAASPKGLRFVVSGDGTGS